MRFLLLLLAALTLCAPPAWACSYAPGDAPKYDSVSSFLTSDFVANVRIIKVYSWAERSPEPYIGRAIVRVLKTYKGELPSVFEIEYNAGSSMCGFDYYTNSETIIFSYKNSSDSDKVYFRPLMGESVPEVKESLEKLSFEQSGKNKDQKSYNNELNASVFVSRLNPGILGLRQQKNLKMLSEEEYLQKIPEILKNCDKALETKITDERITQRMRFIHLRQQIYIAYKEPVEWNISGQKKTILSAWIPFYSKPLDEIEFKDKFFEPVIETSEGKTLILEGCKFPEVTEFFVPAAQNP